ncbi:uncharacterized protein CANTADRAFT_26939 [Suhomyces tanzawaensis NRRL Y-17324]|uniref:F-box domain-containing protein n=1 Tax=Suhomyces tanzawaensis NRRL Y-17324 TaxID=984487 RepID=A0A1E4SEK5_9ASCO|nr:uncharacterized protein CANTADRAFT_26939 [Suhomyces tanzawaensis NRRL Y-17324]ODV77959.1 hypothetical protein CANTADRAFT_26939 [Suhomyces tanzawaensis NRRL Y-17324]
MINQYSLNSPIGYSKNPYNPTQSPQSTSSSALAEVPRGSSPHFAIPRFSAPDSPLNTSESYYSHHSTPQDYNDRATNFQDLPFEVRSRVAAELSQYDCVRLLTVSKTVYSSTIARLYEHIIIDQQFDRFNNEKEYGYKKITMQDGQPVASSCTYINSAFAFKRFLQSTNAHTTSLIRRFDCVDLPDSLNLYDHQLHDQLLRLFEHMCLLSQLVWLNDNFRLEYLHQLPHKHLVSTLVLNIKFSNYLSELEPLPYHEDCKGLVFPNLVNFQIQPFQNSSKLVRIVNNLLVNNNPNVSDNLDTLVLSRYQRRDSTSTMTLPNCDELMAPGRSLGPKDENITVLFKGSRLRYLSNLTCLSLDNLSVSPREARTFIESVNLAGLDTLVLRGILEYLVGNDRCQPFLLEIAQHLTSLKHLSLDHRQALVDSVPEFLLCLPARKLESLDLVIRNNPTKDYLDHGDREREYYDDYARAIGLFRNTLTRLSFEVREEVHGYNDTNNLNILQCVPAHTSFYTQLQQLTHLRCLRVSPGEQVEEVALLVQRLPLLVMLDIFGNKAGGAPNLGLGMVHPTIYDEWFKVQHVALLYLQYNPKLEYIRINQCIFECNGPNIEPRNGISRWFDGKIRLSRSELA